MNNNNSQLDKKVPEENIVLNLKIRFLNELKKKAFPK